MDDSMAFRPLRLRQAGPRLDTPPRPAPPRPARPRPDYRIEPFDTKIDSLRITVADRFQDSEIDGKSADRATPLTDAAETASKTTCDERGAPDRIRNHGEAPTAVRNQSDPRSE
ncbi:hypothetical protein [Streptomyces mobaraensis]|uniref:hypothetical protein n=1 Tax=Streptomyces mobaraensis TaxID=35621 RepID=UPI001FA71101|nr:hypothetical protein [Streptomyces mobaraensis]